MTDNIVARLAARIGAASWGGKPTSVAIIDGAFPDTLARQAAEIDPSGFYARRSFRESKLISRKPQNAAHHAIFTALQDPRIVSAVARLTSIMGLESDTSLYGAGLSVMQRGDFLNPHIDNSHDETRRRYRRLNLLYYCTPDWPDDLGGNLELWDEAVVEQAVVASQFNRLAIMETNRRSWHSVSLVRAERARCCVSTYYFSEVSPEAADYYHVTSFTGRPGQHAQRVFGRVDNRLRQAVSSLGLMRKSSRTGHGAINP